jgi:thiamine-phosphate pyrophosphorylase
LKTRPEGGLAANSLVKPLCECRLYAFVDFAYLHGRSPERVVHQLCDSGADLVQLRGKSLTPEAILKVAERIRPITEAAAIGLVINDYPAIAIKVGADFCHLGQEDFFDAGFTRVAQVVPATSTVRLGLSTHAPAEAERAVAAGAAYIATGPVFPTATKPTVKAVTLEYVRWAATHLTLPWFAIGGIRLENLPEVLAAGARRICVVSALLDAPDLVKACQAFKERLASIPL